MNAHIKYLPHISKLLIAIILTLFAVQLPFMAASQVSAAPSGVAPKTPRLSTPWTAAAVAAIANPLPEYPRPQMVRSSWQSLNGEWQWQSASSIATPPTGQTLSGRINVPYPVESALSGVMQNIHYMWYRRTFTVPSGWTGQQVLLNFGAVDWQSKVYVNGTLKGTHSGGYDAFTYNITAQLNGGTNEIIVGVYDPTDGDGVNQPMGKQRNAPGGIMYTGASGIWQTVWLEPVPTAYVSRLDMTPNIDNGTLNVIVQGTSGQTATVTAYLPGTTTVVGSANGATGANIAVPVPSPHLWSPSDPYLYDLRVTLNGGDAVTGYFGMRKISLGTVNGKLRPLLNNQFLFQMGPLDQGYWPDGIYTAPTDAALRSDIDQAKALGYNMIRKHVKVEPARWYYWTDRLGVLVWQDMPSMPNAPTTAQQTQFQTELQAMVNQHRSYPSIIMWVPFNEGWGQYNTATITNLVKGWDPSRLVNNASGWTDAGAGDIIDFHCYLGPCSPTPTSTRIAVMGEFGGLGLKVSGHEWDAANSHSYTIETSVANLVSHYVSLLQQSEGLVSDPGLSAGVYTEITDVETEVNGWLTYDRILKISSADVTTLRNAHASLINAASVTYTAIVPTSESTAQSWRYTTSTPASNWASTGFSDSAWATGNGGFGTAGTPGAVIRTTWNTADIWLRRTFNPGSLTATQISNLVLRLHHDENAEVYINGVLATSQTGYTSTYLYTPINTAALNAIVTSGNNVLAVHCHQTTGGQYIDAGISLKGGGVTPTPTPTPTATPPTPTPPPGTNVALNKPATADSSCNTNEGPEKAVNGSWTGGNSDKWCSVGTTKWLRVDLGASYSITSFLLRHAGAGGESTSYNTRDFNIQLSADGTNWGSAVVTVTGNTANVTTHNITAVSGRYVRLNVTTPTQTTDAAARIYELEVYGSSTGPTPTPPPTTPIAFYAFENNANDSSGNGYTGTLLNGPTFVAGRVGQAVNLDGVDDYVQIPRSIQDSFSIAFWVKTTTSGGTGTHWYVGKGLVDGEVANVVNDFGVSLVGAQAAFGVGNADTTIKSTSNINDGAWHHVAVTRSSSTGAMVLYIDGVQQASTTGPTGAKNAPANLRIGSLQTNLNFFAGQIDEVRLYNVVLTASQVAALAAP